MLQAQKSAHVRDGFRFSAFGPTASIAACFPGLLTGRHAEIARALNADFGSRARSVMRHGGRGHASVGCAEAGQGAPQGPFPDEAVERRRTSPAILGSLGAKAEVQFQPKGVVGIIRPLELPGEPDPLAPLAGVLGRGQPGDDQALGVHAGHFRA